MREQLLPGLDAIHEDFVDRMIEFYRADPAVGETPGASETFRRLRQAGVRVALNTGYTTAVLPLADDATAEKQAVDYLDAYKPAMVISIEKIGPNPQGVAHTSTGTPTVDSPDRSRICAATGGSTASTSAFDLLSPR